jgi:hypothetical protein
MRASRRARKRRKSVHLQPVIVYRDFGVTIEPSGGLREK